MQSANNIPEKPGVFSVGGHGNPSIMVDEKHQPISPGEMANKIKIHKNHKPGNTIQLYSCNTGKGTNSYAQKLSNELGEKVIAPDKTLWIYPDGRTLPAGANSSRQPDTNDIGSWRVFHPQKKQ